MELCSLIVGFPEKIKHAYSARAPKLKRIFDNIVFVGMGGSYIAGLTFKSMYEKEIKMPVDVRHSVNFVNSHTLYVLISYSGNTQEALNAFKKIKRVHPDNILVISSGGKLLREARKMKTEIIKVPKDVHQRFTFAECFFPLVKVFEHSGYLDDKKEEIKGIIKALKKGTEKVDRGARLLAAKIKDEHPVFYASEYFYPAAYRFQTCLEEDAKMITHSNKITELFHNELEALPASYFFPVLIIDDKETKKYKKQLKYFKKHIKFYTEIGGDGYTREQRMFLLFYFADFLGYYMSELKMKEFGETPISDKIKKK
jgi:glucose/mannose-6-phosphate isomerase